MESRRRFLRRAGAFGAAAALLPAWARSAPSLESAGLPALSGTEFDLEVRRGEVLVDGRRSRAVLINGTNPGPLLRWREGDEVALRVKNSLDEDTSIHWHGILTPHWMDGVPGLSFPGIRPGETFEYRFRVPQNGTYWYHSHSGLQEQIGHLGPLIVDPAGLDPVGYDREYAVVLSDWTFRKPQQIFAKLKKQSDLYNFQRRTVGDFVSDVADDGLGRALGERSMWGRMRMSPVDISDVTAAEYTYLVNGHGPESNWTALFEPGERVRLRLINASAMTIFDVRIPDLAMEVVQADGENVRPVSTDELQIGVAETYDVLVRPEMDRAYTLMCESIERSGYARATLAPRPGMGAEVPPLRPRPTLTMKDMAMDHGAHGTDPAGPPSQSAGHGHETAPMPAPDPHAGHELGMEGSTPEGAPASDPHAGHVRASAPPAPPSAHAAHRMEGAQEHRHRKGPGVVGLAKNPTDRLAEPGVGLDGVSHRVLTYADLESLHPNPDVRPPAREIELHLTGNMERYMWSFDGEKFSDVKGPIVFHKDERLRLTLVNDTMMSHPIHLHGMYFEVVNGRGDRKPRKHTIIVKPGEKLSVDVTADNPGDWAFHCHLLYHMHAGMFQVVSVTESEAPSREHEHHRHSGGAA